MSRVPSAVFLVDITHEHIALKEAQRLNINTFGIVDTNSDPTKVDFAIPGNDDASKSIYLLTNFIADAIAEGLAERAADVTLRVDRFSWGMYVNSFAPQRPRPCNADEFPPNHQQSRQG